MKKPMLAFLLALLALNATAGEVPKWLEGWKVKGDLRLRLESTDFDQSDKESRDRARFRLRISASKKITDQLKVNLRFASGTGDPTSTNQSFDSSFSGKDWRIDRAHLQYESNNWTLHGGKMSNVLHNSDIVWDSDINPEGFFQQYKNSGFYMTLGELFVEESSGTDINLYVAQFGAKGGDSVKYDVSGTYYSYNAADGFLDTGSDSYDFVDLLATIKLKKVSLNFDYVKNVSSFDYVDFKGDTYHLDDVDTAWAVYAAWGGKKPGDWNFALKYAELQAGSSFSDFTDSDFGKGDSEGFVGRIGYQASKRLSWKLNLFSIDSIERTDAGFFRAQLDCAVKF